MIHNERRGQKAGNTENAVSDTQDAEHDVLGKDHGFDPDVYHRVDDRITDRGI